MLETARAKASSLAKAGASARTARVSGRAWSSTRSSDEAGELIGFAKITRDMTERARGAAGPARGRAALPAARPGRHRLCDLHARSRRPRDQLERRRRAHQGLLRPTKSSASISAASTRLRISTPGVPARGARNGARDRPLRSRRLARAQGRHALLGKRRDRRDPRRRAAS